MLPRHDLVNIANDEASAVDIAVIGLGPGGLAAALQAANLGNQVIAFTDRSEYIRGQRLCLASETEIYLENLANPSDPLDQLLLEQFEEGANIQIKDIERFLYRKVLQHPNITIVTIHADNPISYVGIGDTKTANFIQLRDQTNCFCRNILAADGAKHAFATILNTHLNTDIQYSQTSLQERHKYHGVVQLQLKQGEEADPFYLGTHQFPTRQWCVQHGWTESYTPQYYVFSNEKINKFYYAGEIPKCIFDASEETRAALLKTWASAAILAKYDIKEDQLEFRKSSKTPTKDRLQSSVFEMNLVVCNKPTVALTNGMFAQIGDARRTPNYHILHGMNDSIMGGIAFADAITSKNFDIFQNTITKMDEHVELSMIMNKDTIKQATISAEKKLIVLLDDLMKHLERDPNIHAKNIEKLIHAKHDFEQSGHLTNMYVVMDEIQNMVSDDNIRILSRGYDCLLAKCDADNTMEKSVRILDEIKQNMDTIFNAKF